MADLAHWNIDHSSHGLTDAQRRHLIALNTPIVAHVCQNCNWPASIAQLCTVCVDMAEAIMRQKGLMREHAKWELQRRLREMGLL